MTANQWLNRYQRGEYEGVWLEICTAEPSSLELRSEAMAVATETMARVAQNADLIAERLKKLRWKPLTGQFRFSPRPEDESLMKRLSRLAACPIPVSLEAFWRVVGGVDFVWNYRFGWLPFSGAPNGGIKGLELDQMDPLCVYSVSFIGEHLLDEWDSVDADKPCDIILAPDRYHKADTSGGEPYVIALPADSFDPVVQNEQHELPFTDYLRLCFRWGGFPLLAPHAQRSDVRAFVEKMTDGLVPF